MALFIFWQKLHWTGGTGYVPLSDGVCCGETTWFGHLIVPWCVLALGFVSIYARVTRNNVLDTLKTQQSNVWAYQFHWAQQPAPWNTIYGAAHAFDLPFLFGNFGPSLFANVTNSTANRPGRLALSAAMMASLGAFARTGDPNTPALGATWETWPARMVFDATQTQARITPE